MIALAPKDRNYGISTPVFSEGKVRMSAGQDPDSGSGRGAAYSINPAKRGDLTGSGKVWQYEKIDRSISTAAVGNGLAFLSDMDGILHWLDVKTGKPYWTFDLKSPVWGREGEITISSHRHRVAIRAPKLLLRL